MKAEVNQPTKTYIAETFAMMLKNDGSSTTIQATSPHAAGILVRLNEESTATQLKIFCDIYNPVVYNSLSINSVENILEENYLQYELCIALGICLSPLQWTIYENPKRYDAWNILHFYGQKINLGQAIELITDLANVVGICLDERLFGKIPNELFYYIARVATRKKVASKWQKHYQQKKAELKRQQIRSYLEH